MVILPLWTDQQGRANSLFRVGELAYSHQCHPQVEELIAIRGVGGAGPAKESGSFRIISMSVIEVSHVDIRPPELGLDGQRLLVERHGRAIHSTLSHGCGQTGGGINILGSDLMGPIIQREIVRPE